MLVRYGRDDHELHKNCSLHLRLCQAKQQESPLNIPYTRIHISPSLSIWFGVLAMSTAAILIRYSQEGVPSLVIAAYRLTFASLIMLPFGWKKSKVEMGVLTRKELWLLVLSGVLLAVHFASWISSLEFNTVASSVVFVTTTPLWVAFFSPLFLGERLSAKVFLGMGIALLGGVVIGISDACNITNTGINCGDLGMFFRGKAFLGDFLALVGAWTAAGYLMIGRNLRQKMSLSGYTLMVYGIAAAVLIVVAISSGKPLTGYSPLSYFLMLLLAVIPQLMGHSTFNWALKHLSASYVSIALLAEPVSATLMAYFLLAETPTSFKIGGAVFILIGIALATWSSQRNGSVEE